MLFYRFEWAKQKDTCSREACCGCCLRARNASSSQERDGRHGIQHERQCPACGPTSTRAAQRGPIVADRDRTRSDLERCRPPLSVESPSATLGLSSSGWVSRRAGHVQTRLAGHYPRLAAKRSSSLSEQMRDADVQHGLLILMPVEAGVRQRNLRRTPQHPPAARAE